MRVPHATAAHDENGHDGAVSHGHFSPVDLVLPVARDDVPPPVVVPFVSYYVLRYVFLFFLLFSSFFERGAFFYFLPVFFFFVTTGWTSEMCVVVTSSSYPSGRYPAKRFTRRAVHDLDDLEASLPLDEMLCGICVVQM